MLTMQPLPWEVGFAGALLWRPHDRPPTFGLSLFAATKFIGSAQTSLMLNIEPLVTIATAILLLGERLILSQSIGVAVILIALFMTSSESSKFFLFINNNKSD